MDISFRTLPSPRKFPDRPQSTHGSPVTKSSKSRNSTASRSAVTVELFPISSSSLSSSTSSSLTPAISTVSSSSVPSTTTAPVPSSSSSSGTVPPSSSSLLLSPPPRNRPELEARLAAYKVAVEKQANALSRAEARSLALAEENAFLVEKLNLLSNQYATIQAQDTTQRSDLEIQIESTTKELGKLVNENTKLSTLVLDLQHQIHTLSTEAITNTKNHNHLSSSSSSLTTDDSLNESTSNDTVSLTLPPDIVQKLTLYEEVSILATDLHTELGIERARVLTLTKEIEAAHQREEELLKQVGKAVDSVAQSAAQTSDTLRQHDTLRIQCLDYQNQLHTVQQLYEKEQILREQGSVNHGKELEAIRNDYENERLKLSEQYRTNTERAVTSAAQDILDKETKERNNEREQYAFTVAQMEGTIEALKKEIHRLQEGHEKERQHWRTVHDQQLTETQKNWTNAVDQMTQLEREKEELQVQHSIIIGNLTGQIENLTKESLNQNQRIADYETMQGSLRSHLIEVEAELANLRVHAKHQQHQQQPSPEHGSKDGNDDETKNTDLPINTSMASFLNDSLLHPTIEGEKVSTPSLPETKSNRAEEQDEKWSEMNAIIQTLTEKINTLTEQNHQLRQERDQAMHQVQILNERNTQQTDELEKYRTERQDTVQQLLFLKNRCEELEDGLRVSANKLEEAKAAALAAKTKSTLHSTTQSTQSNKSFTVPPTTTTSSRPTETGRVPKPLPSKSTASIPVSYEKSSAAQQALATQYLEAAIRAGDRAVTHALSENTSNPLPPTNSTVGVPPKTNYVSSFASSSATGRTTSSYLPIPSLPSSSLVSSVSVSSIHTKETERIRNDVQQKMEDELVHLRQQVILARSVLSPESLTASSTVPVSVPYTSRTALASVTKPLSFDVPKSLESFSTSSSSHLHNHNTNGNSGLKLTDLGGSSASLHPYRYSLPSSSAASLTQSSLQGVGAAARLTSDVANIVQSLRHDLVEAKRRLANVTHTPQI